MHCLVRGARTGGEGGFACCAVKLGHTPLSDMFSHVCSKLLYHMMQNHISCICWFFSTVWSNKGSRWVKGFCMSCRQVGSCLLLFLIARLTGTLSSAFKAPCIAYPHKPCDAYPHNPCIAYPQFSMEDKACLASIPFLRIFG